VLLAVVAAVAVAVGRLHLMEMLNKVVAVVAVLVVEEVDLDGQMVAKDTLHHLDLLEQVQQQAMVVRVARMEVVLVEMVAD
jgi:hypothetical protein